MSPASSGVFVSYRRQDAGHAAGRLRDWLGEHLAPALVFMDDAIDPGEDFVEAIDHAVSRCAVLLAMIGKRWIAVADEYGRRRLNDPRDWVALEIRTAMTREIRVIPVLVDGAVMPAANELPPALEVLTHKNAVTLGHETFHHDAGRLLEVMQEDLRSHAARSAAGAGSRAVPMREIEESTHRRAADAGDTVAMDNLALLLKQRGASADAERWWRRAAKAGHTGAMNNLGVLEKERGATAEAERWLRRAAEAGEASAMHNYGSLLEQLGVAEPAERLYRQAAEAGVAAAMFSLGLLLQRRGDRRQAANWYQRAGEAGHIGAMIKLGLLLEESGSFVAAANCYGPAADSGNVVAMHNLGVVLYQLGATARAEQWWRRAAEAGDPRSMNNLGVILKARGDLAQAERWWRRASDAGDAIATGNLTTLPGRGGRTPPT